MIEYADRSSELNCDAIVVELNCVNLFPVGTAISSTFPDNVQACRREFDAGKIEPGKLFILDRGNQTPRYIFNFPTKIHSNGETRDEYVKAGIAELLQNALKLGIKSIAIPLMECRRGTTWPEFKLRLVTTFANVPEIRVVFIASTVAGSKAKQVTIFTDGAAEPNPGTGGYGVVLQFGELRKDLSQGFVLTSNNRMELMAAIVGLEALREPCRVRLYSDSRYVVDCVNNGALFRLRSRNWKTCKAKNLDLWQRFLDAWSRHEVEMVWIKGHAGIDDNELCDQLASRALRNGNLLIDQGYVDQSKLHSQSVSAPLAKPGTSPNVKPNPNGSRGPKPKNVGDPCRYCKAPLVRREPKKSKADSNYYYAWYLYCENCKRLYHVEQAKVARNKS